MKFPFSKPTSIFTSNSKATTESFDEKKHQLIDSFKNSISTADTKLSIKDKLTKACNQFKSIIPKETSSVEKNKLKNIFILKLQNSVGGINGPFNEIETGINAMPKNNFTFTSEYDARADIIFNQVNDQQEAQNENVNYEHISEPRHDIIIEIEEPSLKEKIHYFTNSIIFRNLSSNDLVHTIKKHSKNTLDCDAKRTTYVMLEYLCDKTHTDKSVLKDISLESKTTVMIKKLQELIQTCKRMNEV